MYGNTVLSFIFNRSSSLRICFLFSTVILVMAISAVPSSLITASRPYNINAPDCDEILALLFFPFTQIILLKSSASIFISKYDFSSRMKCPSFFIAICSLKFGWSKSISSLSFLGNLAKFAMQLATSESKYLTSLRFIEKMMTSPSSVCADLQEKYNAISGFDVISNNLVGNE
ncbi:hypothetical protein SRABI106_00646 [Rahnella aquatilis]|nr:hypothetical protein SRABI106_00646 [Rahnella aquatilis]